MASNPHILELVRRMDARFSQDSDDMSLGDWICTNTTLRGRPFSFDRYPFQKAIADDMHPSIDVVKPSQIGLTEIQIRKALAFLARNRGTSLIFTLPTDAMFERVSVTRILPLVKDEKAFNLETANGERPTRSKGLMQIGTSFLYVTGSKEGDATSIPADAVFNDEVDLSDQQMLALFGSRMQNSDWKLNQRFSTPTFSNFGIDAGYQNSDQTVYMVKCDACAHWQEPLFNEASVEVPGLPSETPLLEIDNALIDSGRLNLHGSYVCCEKCRAPLDLGRTDNREWVAHFASRTHHRGYRISPFSTDRLSPEYVITQMMKYQEKEYLRGWYNTVLGLPHTAGSARLSDAEISKCFTGHLESPALDKNKPSWLGIDMGQVCHLVLGQGNSKEDQEIVSFRAIPVGQLFDEVQLILDTYNVIGGAVDRHPYTPTAEGLFELSQGRIIPVEYRGTKELNLVGDPLTHAQANRTALIDEVSRVIRLSRIRFSGYGQQKQTITDHLKDMVRDENPEKPANWVKLTGNDHYFHALGFLLFGIALQETVHSTEEQRTSVVVRPLSLDSTGTSLFNTRGSSKSTMALLGRLE